MKKKTSKKKKAITGGVTGKGFVKGQSGNPKGRPSTKPMRDMLKEIVESREIQSSVVTVLKDGETTRRNYKITAKKSILHEILMQLVIKAIDGEYFCIKDVLDRLGGKPGMSVQIKENDKGLLLESLDKLMEMAPDK